jgi:alanine-glyoxylate transaminase/serine-glyoxylate transaminase/serine-pyruvate transaminase
MPDRVLNAMHQAAPNIYEGALIDMMPTLVTDLKAVARTRGHLAIYIANGHGAWEAALANVIAPGEKVLVLATGRFGHGWAEMAQAMGIEAEVLDFGRAAPVDPDRVEARLREDTEGRIKAVLATHVDTSTSVLNDIAGVRAALEAAGHAALLMADCIASLGCDRFEMDAWGVDVTVAACQKGLMVPPGMGFVFFNDRAAEVQARMERVSNYWSWAPRANPQVFYQYFGGTAPTHHLMGQRAALDIIAEEGGIEAVWTRHDQLARAIWAAVDAWGADGPMRLNVTDPTHRSRAVTTVHLGAPHATALRNWVEANAGVTLGIGLGMGTPEDPKSDGVLRIGHMGHVNAHMVLGVLGVIETGLKALGVPHGKGALEAAAGVLARG